MDRVTRELYPIRATPFAYAPFEFGTKYLSYKRSPSTRFSNHTIRILEKYEFLFKRIRILLSTSIYNQFLSLLLKMTVLIELRILSPHISFNLWKDGLLEIDISSVKCM
jgi:hypothetical protein